MIESRRQPASGSVAVVTGVATGDMCRLLADGNNTVMAGYAGPNDLGVINGHHRRKYIRGMAILADI